MNTSVNCERKPRIDTKRKPAEVQINYDVAYGRRRVQQCADGTMRAAMRESKEGVSYSVVLRTSDTRGTPRRQGHHYATVVDRVCIGGKAEDRGETWACPTASAPKRLASPSVYDAESWGGAPLVLGV